METGDSKTLGRYATLLSLTEIGLGSLLHAFYVPFAGHFLSLNQGFLLSHAVKNANGSQKSFLFPTHISNVSALFKSLAPAGKKLTPMLAITAQGYLFSLGVLLFGPTFLGFTIGMTLLSLWAFAQPVLIYYLIFGNALFESYLFLLEGLNKHLHLQPHYLLYLLLTVILLKLFFAWSLVIALYFVSEKKQDGWFKKLERLAHLAPARRGENVSKLRHAFKGLMHPLFLISLFVSIFFFIFAENKNSQLIWLLARPVAIGFLLHFLFQFLPTEKWVKYLISKTN